MIDEPVASDGLAAPVAADPAAPVDPVPEPVEATDEVVLPDAPAADAPADAGAVSSDPSLDPVNEEAVKPEETQ
jgi:hypothetical protein